MQIFSKLRKLVIIHKYNVTLFKSITEQNIHRPFINELCCHIFNVPNQSTKVNRNYDFEVI